MSKRQLSALLGFWVIIFLFLGFPAAWDKWIAVVTGILIIVVAYRKNSKQKTGADDAFVQSNPQSNSHGNPASPSQNSGTSAQ